MLLCENHWRSLCGALGHSKCLAVGRWGEFKLITWVLLGFHYLFIAGLPSRTCLLNWENTESEGEEVISEAQLKVWAMDPSDWLLKAVCFEGGRTFSQAGPRKLLFTYKTCQKAELSLSALKPTNQRETNHWINRFLCDCSKAKCLKLSAVLTVSGAWFGLLKAECTNSKESSRLSLAC